MGNKFKEEGFKSRNKNIKKASNRLLYTFLIVFLAGYAFFFSSTLWLPNYYTGVTVTPLGTEVSQNERVVTIDEWVFSKEQRVMEIVVEVENLSVDGVHDYIWLVKTKEGQYKTSVVASDDEIVVIHAERLPRDWTEASLTMDVKGDDKDKMESWTPLVIYTDNKIVENVESIETRSITEYKVAAYNKRINLTEEKIKTAEAELSDINAKIAEAEDNIKTLQEKMEYQTESEKEESARQIDAFTGQLQQLTLNKQEKEKEIAELKEKIELTKKLLEATEHPEAAPQDNREDNS